MWMKSIGLMLLSGWPNSVERPWCSKRHWPSMKELSQSNQISRQTSESLRPFWNLKIILTLWQNNMGCWRSMALPTQPESIKFSRKQTLMWQWRMKRIKWLQNTTLMTWTKLFKLQKSTWRTMNLELNTCFTKEFFKNPRITSLHCNLFVIGWRNNQIIFTCTTSKDPSWCNILNSQMQSEA